MHGVAIRRGGRVSRPGLIRRGITGAIVALLAAIPSAALAQGAKEYLTVAALDTPLVSGDAPGSYSIQRLSVGQVLVSDGGTDEWKRVSYPAGGACYLRADEATLDDAAKVATLTKPSRLRAINQVNGRKGSWRVALDAPLPVGTKLNVLSIEEDPDPRARTFRVAAPEAARAYVRAAQVRPATAEEIAVHTAQFPETPAPGVTPDTPAGTTPTTPQGAGEGNLTQPQSPTGVTPAPVTPTPEEGAVPAENPQPQPPPVGATQTPERRYLDLIAVFDSARRSNQFEAELDMLIVAFEGALGEMDQAQRDSRLGRSLQSRLDVLRLGADIRDEKQALAAARDSATGEAERLALTIAEIERRKVYTLVGRLGASAVYDGARLPRLYRVQAVGTAIPITLGYLKPDEKLELDSKLGSIVGIVGDGAIDAATGARVITPQRIDVLTPEQTGAGSP